MTVVALVIAAAAVVAIAGAYGFSRFGHAWTNLHGGWLALTILAQALAVAAYVPAYRAAARVQGGPRLRLPLVARVVTAGFAPYRAAGGFAADQRALRAITGDKNAANVRVLGLGALEWALLAPAACVAAVVLLATGDRHPMPSLLWPWAIAVPVGFAIGLSVATPARRERLMAGGGSWREGLARALNAVEFLRVFAREIASCWSAWVGMGLYWALDIASFYGASRFIGMQLNLGEVILAYATGYALTRRSMPLAGAGVTEALMTFAVHWVGQPVAPALAVVVVYRVFNLALPAVPALLARPYVKPLLDAGESGKTPARTQRRRAAAPLGGRG